MVMVWKIEIGGGRKKLIYIKFWKLGLLVGFRVVIISMGLWFSYVVLV